MPRGKRELKKKHVSSYYSGGIIRKIIHKKSKIPGENFVTFRVTKEKPAPLWIVIVFSLSLTAVMTRGMWVLAEATPLEERATARIEALFAIDVASLA